MNVPKELSKFGLVSPTRQTRRRLIMTTEAETGCGKSRLMLETAPRPLLHIDIDNNSEPIEENYVGDDVLIWRAQLDEDPNQDQYFERLKMMKSLVEVSAEKKMFRSYNFDTGDKLWDWVQIAILGSKEFGDNSRTEYRKCNNFMTRLFDLAKSERFNLCMSHHMKDERVKGKSERGKDTSIETGRRIMSGWKRAKEQGQLHLRLFKDAEEEGTDKFKAEIMKCTVRTQLEGMVLSGKEISVVKLGRLVFPMSEPEEWL